MKTVSPTGTNSASYTTSNSAQACPTVGSSWEAKASPLPPSPDQELCSCMYNSLTCIGKSSLSDTEVGELFGEVCGASSSACDGITHNGTTGEYGAYSMCNSTEQLAWVLNAYYEEADSSNKASACGWDGSATTKSATSAKGTCSVLMAEAGTAGTGSVSSSPTATGAGAAASSGSGSTSTSSGSAASSVKVPSSSFGVYTLCTYVFAAGLSGIAMLVL